MIARITSDKVTLPEADKPTAIKVDDADVDAELLRLKDHAVTAEVTVTDGRSPVSIPSPPAVVPPTTTHHPCLQLYRRLCSGPTQVVDPNMALKLQELSAQIAAISQQLNNGSGALSTVQPA
jgi:hypothetical protein